MIGPSSAACTGSRLRASGTIAKIRPARSNAGIVTVIAWGGTVRRPREVALPHLLAAARLVEGDDLHVERVVEVSDRGVVEGEVAVLADAEAAEVERRRGEERRVPGAFRAGISGVSFDVVEGAERHLLDEPLAEIPTERGGMLGG